MLEKDSVFYKIEDFLRKNWSIIALAALAFVIVRSIGLGIVVGGAVAYKRSKAIEIKVPLPARLVETFLGAFVGAIIIPTLDKFGAFLIGHVGEVIGVIIGIVIVIFAGIKIADIISKKRIFRTLLMPKNTPSKQKLTTIKATTKATTKATVQQKKTRSLRKLKTKGKKK